MRELLSYGSDTMMMITLKSCQTDLINCVEKLVYIYIYRYIMVSSGTLYNNYFSYWVHDIDRV